MTRRFKARSITLLRHQIEYLDQRCDNSYSRSRWIREAIDARISVEIEEARKIVQRGVIAAKHGDVAAFETKHGHISDTQRQAIGDFRASVQSELAKLLLNPSGDVPVPEGGQPEVREDVPSEERSE